MFDDGAEPDLRDEHGNTALHVRLSPRWCPRRAHVDCGNRLRARTATSEPSRRVCVAVPTSTSRTYGGAAFRVRVCNSDQPRRAIRTRAKPRCTSATSMATTRYDALPVRGETLRRVVQLAEYLKAKGADDTVRNMYATACAARRAHRRCMQVWPHLLQRPAPLDGGDRARQQRTDGVARARVCVAWRDGGRPRVRWTEPAYAKARRFPTC